jgi:hypothetical protein
MKVKHAEKMHGGVLLIQNTSTSPTAMSLVFNGSKNIRINHTTMMNNTLDVNLEGGKELLLEILPNNPK